MKIYVVMGSTGEYSDRGEWPVKACVSEDRAKELVKNASDCAREIFASRENKFGVEIEVNPFDPEMRMDYTGTSYFYYAVDVDYEQTNYTC